MNPLNRNASGRHFLQIPGPTNVPDRVLRAIDAPTIDHRGPEFAVLGKAVIAGLKKVFKTDIPLVDRTPWEDLIAKTRPEIHALTAEIARIEGEINTRVYALFDLTPDEIALLEANI